VTLVATNDYTKNISSFIFSPSLDQHPPSANRYKTAYQTPQKPKKQGINQVSTPARSQVASSKKAQSEIKLKKTHLTKEEF
jgi:hypothetical protein